MNCKFPNPCWFSINALPVGSAEINLLDPVIQQSPYSVLEEMNKYWDVFYSGWQSRPNKPDFLDKTMAGLLLNLAEFVVDAQIETLNDIRNEKYKDENLYTDVERDRVNTIGFKPIWTPGGFQV